MDRCDRCPNWPKLRSPDRKTKKQARNICVECDQPERNRIFDKEYDEWTKTTRCKFFRNAPEGCER